MRPRSNFAPLASRATLALALGLCLSAPAIAGGLRCSLGEVVITDLKIGQTYSLNTLAHLPLAITNTGEGAVSVRVDPLIPGAGDLRQGSEAIPDSAWASASPNAFDLAPHETRLVELGLRIPDDDRLRGRKFEVLFWSHTLPKAGDLLTYGLNSRVIFTVDHERAAPGDAPIGDLSITLTPPEIHVVDVTAGRAYPIGDALQPPLVVQNTSTRSLSVEVQALRARGSATTLPAGCAELLDAAEVKLSPTRFTLGPGEQRTITGTVAFPKGKRLKTRPLMCVVSAAVMDQPVHNQIYARIYAQPR